MYATQVLVINELSPEDVLFLRCLSPKTNPILIDKLTEDFELNKNNKLYNDYMNEYSRAAEPPVRCGKSHHSGLAEPPFIYSYCI